ncbi:winged helix-turn-helix transcriptional regulator [Alteraurantiacibacter aquimixticola]|uniref:Transcriptional regulator n=1 Tax=Alteraurantiacibacter aquimixticola TaxID=2489173 RepID=A0A4T3F5I4_9SPHN|nr:helix-turn-helix domain-containing protein [Alteraurantiacibacter aquimixticola]TIX51739.1 transcriptional regulator [Alteraurantiacibacter aquimixticola]
MSQLPFAWDEIAEAKRIRDETAPPPNEEIDPKLEALVTQIIGQVADKWTMLVLEELEERGCLRFTQIARGIPDISQKMLTQTLRQMEREGLLTRTVHPVVPPHVDYELTDLGHSLGAAFCGVWLWAEENMDRIERARADFDARAGVVKA